MSNGKISSRQKEILDYIKDQIILKGYPPSVRDIIYAGIRQSPGQSRSLMTASIWRAKSSYRYPLSGR